MSIPASYFGHKDFLEKGIVKDFYSLSSKENADKWVQEDIITRYGTDYRVHLVRVTAKIVDVVVLLTPVVVLFQCMFGLKINVSIHIGTSSP